MSAVCEYWWVQLVFELPSRLAVRMADFTVPCQGLPLLAGPIGLVPLRSRIGAHQLVLAAAEH